jgi:hypothetical protein
MIAPLSVHTCTRFCDCNQFFLAYISLSLVLYLCFVIHLFIVIILALSSSLVCLLPLLFSDVFACLLVRPLVHSSIHSLLQQPLVKVI